LNKGIKDDFPSGSTPRKRKWQYRDEWLLTKSRSDLLSDWQERSDCDDGDKVQEHFTSTKSRGSTYSARTSVDSKSKTEAAEIENAGPSVVTEEKSATQFIKAADTLSEPLVESRKRNYVSTTRTTRRMR